MPKVSVVMPVYNGGKYLHAAIDSILTQTFSDFELLIINDGSTDNSDSIIMSYTDVRVKYFRNEMNIGVAATLNKGILLSVAKYIARMDADDICLPERFEKQVAYLDSHADVAVIDCAMQYMTENGIPLNKFNSKVKSYNEIKKMIPWRNCLGHSSVMYHRQIVTEYLYRQVIYEDLDLWYRLINDGYIIERLEDPLLLYRIHDASITACSKADHTHFKKILHTRFFYLYSLKTPDYFRLFNLLILLGTIKDYITLKWKRVRQ